MVFPREHVAVLPCFSILILHRKDNFEFSHNVPNAIKIASPILVLVRIWSLRSTKIGSKTQMQSVATPKAVFVVSSFQHDDEEYLPLKALETLERVEVGVHRPSTAGFQTACKGMH